jgi:hypothetical protein
MKRKAQGLSLTTIIIAAVGLVVLVVLVAIFTGRMSLFGLGISKVARTELAGLQIDYDECHPSRGMERLFLKALDDAEDESEEAVVLNQFENAMSSCASQNTQDSCVTHIPSEYTGVSCAWS